MPWERLAKGTRLWRGLILADVVLYFLAAMVGFVAATSGGTALALVALTSVGLLITTGLRISVGHHWRNGPPAFRSVANAYLIMAVINILVSLSSTAAKMNGESSMLDLLSIGLTIGMVFVALVLQKKGASAAAPVHAQSVSGLTTFLAIFIPVGLVISLMVPGLMLIAGLLYLLWLNRLTKVLKSLAEAYAGRTNVAATFD